MTPSSDWATKRIWVWHWNPPWHIPHGLNWEKGPVKYLGVIMGQRPHQIAQWEELLSDLTRSTQSWSRIYLTLWGRSSVFHSRLLPKIWYLAQHTIPPPHVVQGLKSLQDQYMWGGGKWTEGPP